MTTRHPIRRACRPASFFTRPPHRESTGHTERRTNMYMMRGQLGEIGEPPVAPTGPHFRVQCPAPAGCPPLAAGQCGPTIRQAINAAIQLAENASTKLEAAVAIEPAKRDADAKETARLF